MSAQILDGRKVREVLMEKLISRVKSLSFVPTLAIVQVGEKPDSVAFIRSKKIFAKKIGVETRHIQVPENITENNLLKILEECNDDPAIQGVIVQLPLPPHLNKDKIVNAVKKEKDADGLKSSLAEGDESLIITPATARGVYELLKFYDIDLAQKGVVVIGRSMLVGTPVAEMCRKNGAEVTVCHSLTANLAENTRKADIIISATGKPGLIGKEHVKNGQIVVDVGIIRTADGGLVGDVNFDEVKDIVGAITPVPGGVGQMTVLALFENLLDLCQS